MSEDTTQQSVVDDTKAPAVQGDAVDSARDDGKDDLDTLLSQFEDKPAPVTQPVPTASGGDDLKVLAEQVKGMVSEHQQQVFRRDMTETVKTVRGELDAEFFDDRFVEAWMDAQAREDPRLAKAWTERHANPKQFSKVVETLGRSFHKKYGKLPDKGATDDREAVSAAVRGASTKAPEGKAPEFGRMNDAEFRDTVYKEYGIRA